VCRSAGVAGSRAPTFCWKGKPRVRPVPIPLPRRERDIATRQSCEFDLIDAHVAVGVEDSCGLRGLILQPFLSQGAAPDFRLTTARAQRAQFAPQGAHLWDAVQPHELAPFPGSLVSRAAKRCFPADSSPRASRRVGGCEPADRFAAAPGAQEARRPRARFSHSRTPPAPRAGRPSPLPSAPACA
jgi:hypothetical protein